MSHIYAFFVLYFRIGVRVTINSTFATNMIQKAKRWAKKNPKAMTEYYNSRQNPRKIDNGKNI